jgi:hypothetical protein
VNESVQDRLKRFAVGVLERRGALVEWPEPFDEGLAVLDPALAARMKTSESLRLSLRPESGGLCANLATDFLERMEPLVTVDGQVGAFHIADAYLKKGSMDEAVAKAFTWQNARVKVKEANPTRVEYHFWNFLAQLHSEDRWEDVISVAMNTASRAEVQLPDPEQIHGMESGGEIGSPLATYSQAVRCAANHIERRASAFVARLASRLGRDRKRVPRLLQRVVEGD